MVWRIRNPFKTREPETDSQTAGYNGWGAPLAIAFAKRPLPPSDNAASYAFQTYLSPRWTPIGGGIPNKRDIGTSKPAYSLQGVLVQQVGSPGILAGAFVSGPLTNVSTDPSEVPVELSMLSTGFRIPSN